MARAQDRDPRRRAAARTALAALLFAAVAGLLALRAWHLVNEPGAPSHERWVLQDFRDAIYYPVVAALDGVNPYDVPAYRSRYPVGQEFPVYSPLTLLLHLPYGLLPYRAAEAAYVAVTLALTLLLAGVSLRLAGAAARADRVLILAALLLLSRPGRQPAPRSEHAAGGAGDGGGAVLGAAASVAGRGGDAGDVQAHVRRAAGGALALRGDPRVALRGSPPAARRRCWRSGRS
ncbi:MAG: hypothetical protein U0802_22805 [Candidatus Binatia bacterium]